MDCNGFIWQFGSLGFPWKPLRSCEQPGTGGGIAAWWPPVVGFSGCWVFLETWSKHLVMAWCSHLPITRRENQLCMCVLRSSEQRCKGKREAQGQRGRGQLMGEQWYSFRIGHQCQGAPNYVKPCETNWNDMKPVKERGASKKSRKSTWFGPSEKDDPGAAGIRLVRRGLFTICTRTV